MDRHVFPVDLWPARFTHGPSINGKKLGVYQTVPTEKMRLVRGMYSILIKLPEFCSTVSLSANCILRP